MYDIGMIFPPKLKRGDTVRVIAPSCSMSSMEWLNDEYLKKVENRFASMGLHVTYAKHVREMDVIESSSIESRLEDLHDAFHDPAVHAMITIRGGFSSNGLVKHIDYDLIRKNPKILCGFSDITVLQNAITAKTGLVTYSGPSYYSFGYGEEFDYTLEYWKKCLMEEGPIEVTPSKRWTSDRWSPDKKKVDMKKNAGYRILQEGEAEGHMLGGNISVWTLLQGTEFFPDLSDAVVFVEDDYEAMPHHFDARLQSILLQRGSDRIRGLVIGRFQPETEMTEETLRYIIGTKRELKNVPVIANVDFGHTQPMITFPIGGTVKINARKNDASIEIVGH